MKIEIETPVSMKQGYPSEFTKFGTVTKIEDGKATVFWAAEEAMESPNHGRRVNRHSTVAVKNLQVWPEETRIRLAKERITITASGMEYRTPKQ